MALLAHKLNMLQPQTFPDLYHFHQHLEEIF